MRGIFWGAAWGVGGGVEWVESSVEWEVGSGRREGGGRVGVGSGSGEWGVESGWGGGGGERWWGEEGVEGEGGLNRCLPPADDV